MRSEIFEASFGGPYFHCRRRRSRDLSKGCRRATVLPGALVDQNFAKDNAAVAIAPIELLA